MERMTGYSSSKPVGSKGKRIFIFLHAAVFFLLALVYLLVPMYELVSDNVTSYRFFWEAKNGLSQANGIFFLVVTILGAVALVVSAIFYLVSFLYERHNQADKADKRFMTAGIIGVVANALLALQCFSASFVIAMVVGIVFAVLGLLSMYLYFKKLAALADD